MRRAKVATGTAPSVAAGRRLAVRHDRAAAVAILVAAAVSTIIAWHSATHLEILWDEQVDHDIAVGLRTSPLFGEQPTLDGSQMRLPMYVNALVFALTGRDDLMVMRAVSVVIGAVTVLAAGGLARALFGPLVGALTALLLGTSPYFLAYARVAMTEGDVFLACLYTLTTWAFVAHDRRPSGTRWIACAVLLGLAVGSKLHGAILILVPVLLTFTRRGEDRPSADRPAAGGPPRFHRAVIAGLFVIALTLIPGAVARESDALSEAAARSMSTVGWGLACVLWIIGLRAGLRADPARPGRWVALAGLAGFALITVCVWMPVHLLEHEIPRTIARRVLQWDDAVPLARWGDHLRLYAGIVAIKQTVPWGIACFAGLSWAVVRAWGDRRWRPPLIGFLAYVTALCFLPLRQTFYLMAVYPLLMVMLAAFIVHIGLVARRLGRPVAVAWVICVAGMLTHLGYRVAAAYPHFHLHGHELVGNRWLGAESRGYRNLIQTPSDGVASLIRWCDEHASPGDRVVSYLWEDHIIDRLVSASSPGQHSPGQYTPGHARGYVGPIPANPTYTLLRRGLTAAGHDPPRPPPVDGADYVLLHLNNRLGYGDRPPDWPDEPAFSAGFAPVYTVVRSGIPVGWVYAPVDPPPGAAQKNP